MQTAVGEALCLKTSTLDSSDKPVISTTHRTGRFTLPSRPSEVHRLELHA